jgi:hypothetical protein
LDYWRTNSAAMPPSYREKFVDGEMEFSTIRLYICQRGFLPYRYKQIQKLIKLDKFF